MKEFTPHPVFDPSLFVEIRKRVGHEIFEALNVELIKSVSEKKDKKHNQKETDKNNNTSINKGKIQVAVIIADQYITYPTRNGVGAQIPY